MKKAKKFINKILHPPVGVIVILSIIAIAGLIYIFANDHTRSAATYLFYILSAYSLVILILDLTKRIPRIKNKVFTFIVKKTESVGILNNYLTDYKFKNNVNLYQGVIIDVIYAVFRLITGIIFLSVWFITLAVYHLFLGLLRVYLIVCCRKEKNLAENLAFEYNCYKITALLLFLLNIPMSGTIVLMVCANSAFNYPGYVIYLSALYAFYKIVMSIINLVKYKNVGSPILSSAKVVNFVAAMMSILGLQTAMIATFSVDRSAFRFACNAITGGAITIAVIAIAVYMTIKAEKKLKKLKSIEGVRNEQIGE